MINNYLISLLMCLGIIAAGLGGLTVVVADRAVARRWNVASSAAVLLGVVCAILVIVNWTAST